jgi:uncharacterized protein
MGANRHWLLLGIATAAGALLLAERGDLGRLLPRADARGPQSVDDRAPVLAAVERERIAEYHAALRDAHDIDYRVLAVDSGTDLERTAHDYFAGAEVGSLSETGRGLLLVIDAANQRVRLEVSTSLEGVYTDAFVAYVQTRQMAPFFAAGRVADGILATTELIVGRANEARAGEEFAPPMPARSMGGGASARAPIGTTSDPSEELKRQTERVSVAGLDPLQIVETYHVRMAERDARPDLALYSSDTVTMLQSWVVTPAQMDKVVQTYRGCTVDGVRTAGDAAVVRYRVEQRQCAPYFLRREDAAWKLDLTQLSSAFRFNHENQWRFQTPLASDYEFAFSDWRIDRNGFPHALP